MAAKEQELRISTGTWQAALASRARDVLRSEGFSLALPVFQHFTQPRVWCAKIPSKDLSIGNAERERRMGKKSEFIVKYNCLYSILGRIVMCYYNDWVKNRIKKTY